ncbi:MAG: CBS domain-containing protein [Legionellales bacterium]|nr:CBS domain-containing protein [Legionellales bacterium]
MKTDSPTSSERSWLERLSKALLREPKDREQLVNLLRDAEDRQLLDADTLGMIEGVLQVSEMQVRDIMIPRHEMVTIDSDAEPATFLPIIIQSKHSRFPVMGDDRNDVIGILLAKDLLAYAFQPSEDFELEEIIRPTIFVPESKRLDAMLKEFRQNYHHMAIVVDEYGGVAGCVTIEDVLEQIVGDIEDEFDVDKDSFIKRHNDSEFIIKARTPIENFNEYFSTQFSDEEFDTIGGLVINSLGHLPRRGETVRIGDFDFEVIHADKRRVHLLKMIIHEKITA